MTVELTKLSETDPAVTDELVAETKQRLNERMPELLLDGGPFHDTLLVPHGELGSLDRTNRDRYLRARSMYDIQRDPTLAAGEEAIVDQVLSNFNAVRQPAQGSTGQLTIVLSSATTTVISAGSVFIGAGQRFLTVKSFAARANSALIANDSDRLLSQVGTNRWAFQVDVRSENTGVATRLAKGTLCLPTVPPLNFVTSHATSDFIDGRDADTNQELINRQLEGISPKTMSGPVAMAAFLRSHWPDIVALSFIGMGDVEMHRDNHSIFPVSGGGRVDIYVRSEPRVRRLAVTKSCRLVEKVGDNESIWQATLDRDEAPGYYEARNIRPAGDLDFEGGCEVVLDQRALVVSDYVGYKPDMADLVEGGYSRFQAGSIRFLDTITDVSELAEGAEADYVLEMWYQTLVDEMQDLVSARESHSLGADTLIRAAVPMFCELNFTIVKRYEDESPDLDEIKQALVRLVGGLDFTGSFYASQVHDLVHSYLQPTQRVGDIDMIGRLRYPDGGERTYRSHEALIVPSLPEECVTARTVQFFLEPEDIEIVVTNSVPSSL